MNSPDPFTRPLAGCEAVQAQISDLANSGAATLPPELRAHLDACADCTDFADAWLAGAPAELARPAATGTHAALRERILNAAATPPNVVKFAPASHPPRTLWLGRIAAVLVVAGLASWLLDPVRSTGRKPTVAAAPTLSQSLVKTERRSQREQQTIQTALVDGGSEVHGNVAWAVSALDL